MKEIDILIRLSTDKPYLYTTIEAGLHKALSKLAKDKTINPGFVIVQEDPVALDLVDKIEELINARIQSAVDDLNVRMEA